MPSLLESVDVSGFTAVLNSVRDRKEYEAVAVLGRSELSAVEAWPRAFSHLRKDNRYYEIVEDTICPEFKYRYFAIKTKAGDICAIQPFFVLDQDLLAGAGPR
ncbi:MAG: GNAT family N-acetyltransferase, partial [Rhodomicrobium sp.]